MGKTLAPPIMQSKPQKPVIVIFGPTASGKSALALALAEQARGMVINSDSMQIYRNLRIITARPTIEEEARVPHRLFGVLDASDIGSAARWAQLARAAITEADAAGLWPILVGGTGLYLKALFEGLSPMPTIPDATRRAARDLLSACGVQGLYDDLAARDPKAAAQLESADRQRVLRAWEVIVATGRSILDWRVQQGDGLDRACFSVFIDPSRQDLYARINARFEAMIEQGAVEELKAWIASCGGQLDPLWPLARAHGVPELRAWMEGRLAKEDAVARAQQITRHYAKRQATWARHQFTPNLKLCHLLSVESASAPARDILAQIAARG